ncbi:hypothetical protein, partial [Streptomyces sp. NPDC058548]|uniref:hypothetical protein n=1 Tax=Streptomyces sp. NPDC058548 TaxID=3346545 RepID=UPI00365D06C0
PTTPRFTFPHNPNNPNPDPDYDTADITDITDTPAPSSASINDVLSGEAAQSPVGDSRADLSESRTAQLRAAYEDVLSRYPEPPIDLEEFSALDVRDPRLKSLEDLERGLLPALAAHAEREVESGRSLTEAARAIAASLRVLPADLEGFTHRLMVEHRPRYRHQFELVVATIESDAERRQPDGIAESASSAGESTALDVSVTDAWARHFADVYALRAAFQDLPEAGRNAFHERASGYLNSRIGGMVFGSEPGERLLAEERLLRVSKALRERGASGAEEEASRIARELNLPVRSRQVGGSGAESFDLEAFLREGEEAGAVLGNPLNSPLNSSVAESSSAAMLSGPGTEGPWMDLDSREDALYQPVDVAELEQSVAEVEAFGELSGDELILLFELRNFLQATQQSDWSGSRTAEHWLTSRGRTVWDPHTGTLLPDTARLLKPLASLLSQSDVARIGGVDLMVLEALMFDPMNVASAREALVTWLEAAGIVVLPAALALAGKALYLARGPQGPHLSYIAEQLLGTPQWANRTNNQVGGYLDAAGFRIETQLTRDQMMVAIAAQLASRRTAVPVSERAIVEDVLNRRHRQRANYPRIRAWRDATLYLAAVGSEPSPYRAFVERAVEVARALVEPDGSVDVARVAARVFGEGVGVAGVSRPSAEERAAVRFWLEQAGVVRLVDSVDGDAPRPVRVFPPRGGGVGARILLLAGDFRPSPPGRETQALAREAIDFAVWSIAGATARGERSSLAAVGTQAYGEPDAMRKRTVISGALEAVGLGAFVERSHGGTASRMTAVLAEARRIRAAGEKLDVWTIDGSRRTDNKYSKWVLGGWFLAFGFMGGPIEANSVLGLLRGAVRAMAE